MTVEPGQQTAAARDRTGPWPRLLLELHAGRVQRPLDDEQWRSVTEGQITDHRGVHFTRCSTRVKRADADAMVARGVPLVLFNYGGGQLDHVDGADAVRQWQDVRAALTSQAPRPRGAVVWTGGRWVSEDGDELLLLTGRC